MQKIIIGGVSIIAIVFAILFFARGCELDQLRTDNSDLTKRIEQNLTYIEEIENGAGFIEKGKEEFRRLSEKLTGELAESKRINREIEQRSREFENQYQEQRRINQELESTYTRIGEGYNKLDEYNSEIEAIVRNCLEVIETEGSGADR